MKDFDRERNERPRRTLEERTFSLGGQTFVLRDRFRPEVLVPLEEIEEPITDKTTCNCDHRLHEHNENGKVGACQEFGCQCNKFTPKVLEPGSSLVDQLAAIDLTITGMIDPADDSAARYAAVRSREDDPLEIEDLTAIIEWATAKDTDRPTGQPSVSTPGPAATGESSTDVSSLPVPAAA